MDIESQRRDYGAREREGEEDIAHESDFSGARAALRIDVPDSAFVPGLGVALSALKRP
jgi:hypothetical protein